MENSSAADEKLLKEGCVVPRLKSSLQNLYSRHHDNCQDVYRT